MMFVTCSKFMNWVNYLFKGLFSWIDGNEYEYFLL